MWRLGFSRDKITVEAVNLSEVRKVVTPDLEKSLRKKTDGQMKQVIETAIRQIKSGESVNLSIPQNNSKK